MSEQYSSLAEYYAKEYLDKIFYFCLKKTGSAEQAEDLAQEISLCVLEELSDGVIPDHFHAWVWQICRNRYARWADRKHKQSDASSGWDVTDLAEADQPADESPETALIAKEEQELLRRELAFTAGEYREILIAYYFEQKRVSEIALKLSISESAVKQRLHRARNKLKEGMNMARTFGKKSINPESIYFAKSGYQPGGLPDSALERMIPQNIVIEAHNNPSTAEELAMELGIALPYMEQEIQILLDATLLKKTADGKYLTNFFIADNDTQATVQTMSLEMGKLILPAMKALIGQMKDKLLAAGVKPASMSEEDFLWLVSIDCCRRVYEGIQKPGVFTSFERPNGGNWGIIGFETGYPDRLGGLGQNGSVYGGSVGLEFWVHGPRDFDFCQPDERMGHELINDNRCLPLVRDVLDGKRTFADFSDNEQVMWNADNMSRYVHEENGQTVFDLPVYRGNFDQLWGEELRNCEGYGAAKELCVKFDQQLHDYLRSITDPNLHEQIDFVAAMLGNSFPTAILGNLYADGVLKEPADGSQTNATCYLIVR